MASLADLEAGRIGITQKVLVGMRGSYGGVLMFGERLSRRQIGGLAGLLAGVAVVAGTHT